MTSDPVMDSGFDPGYDVVPYKYPRLERQPVVRIPVAGPDPYNTLVVVRGVFWMSTARTVDYGAGPLYSTHSELLSYRGQLITNFALAGFHPNVKPPCEHSTTAALQLFQKLQKLRFLQAVGHIVEGYFNEEGKWVVVIETASIDEAIGGARAYLSSWVLCYEPPPDPQLPRGPAKFQNYGQSWTAEASLEEQRRLKRIFKQKLGVKREP